MQFQVSKQINDSSPEVILGSNTGSGPAAQVDVKGDRTFGLITINTGDNPSGENIGRLIFEPFYNTDNLIVELRPYNRQAMSVCVAAEGIDNGGFEINSSDELNDNDVYQFIYEVVEIISTVNQTPCPEPQTNEEVDPVFFDNSQTKQAVQFTVDAEGPYNDGLGRPPLVGIYKNGMNSKNVVKGWPTYVGFDITVSNQIGFQMGSGTTFNGTNPIFKVLENGIDKTDEWGTGSKEFSAGVIPNIKFIYVNPY